MNISIPESWLREHLRTEATIKEIAKILSLTSASVERIIKVGDENVLDIEVTTNRADLMSVIGIAKEAWVSLTENNIQAKFDPLKIKETLASSAPFPIEVKYNPSLTNRVCAAVMDVKAGQSPKKISDQLEASGIRSLNNLIDVTNYVMREIGHPTHVFDLDRLNTKTLTIRRSQKGEVIETLDGKIHSLLGDDIVAVDDNGRIVDLLGVMGTANSVVNNETKRILFFVDNNNPTLIRNTSMNLGIRTEAAVINEKGIDPNLSIEALHRGIELYQEIASGIVTSKVLDIYPNKVEEKTITVPVDKISKVIGVEISSQKSKNILEGLGFDVSIDEEKITVKVPTSRLSDISIDEDIIEEIARIYGYHKLPSAIPTFLNNKPYKFDNSFYFEQRIKNAMKYIGFTEVYTYSMVSEDLFEGSIDNALKIKNPLSEDMSYLRSDLVPSLLSALAENKGRDKIKIFELSNTYQKKKGGLPKEKLKFAAAIKKPKNSYLEVKGIIEAVLKDLGIGSLGFSDKDDGIGAKIKINNDYLGYIEVLDNQIVDFELDFELILKHASVKKTYKPLSKFPPVIEDLSLEVSPNIKIADIIFEIKRQSDLISEVGLLDSFGDKKTFHIIYHDPGKTLSTKEVSDIRTKIIASVENKFQAKAR